MDRLSALDAEFLDLEDGVSHMHIAGMCVFEGSPPTVDELCGLLSSKLHRIPRYRQRLARVPLEMGRPVWVDDPTFRVEEHVHATALAPPQDDAAVSTLMGRLMSAELDRERPLWDCWIVHDLPLERWALVCKVHHCMVDGIAGVGLLEALLDLSPDTPVAAPEPWRPVPAPSGAALALDAWAGAAAELAHLGVGALGALRDPVGSTRSAVRVSAGLSHFLGHLAATPPNPLEGPIGAHRVWAHSSATLADVRRVRASLGGTVNDVVLAAVTHGYRELLVERGVDPATVTLRTLVPVSVRRTDATGVPDNRVSAILYELPVHEADPLRRLARVRERMAALKGSHMSDAGEAITRLGDLVPPVVLGNVTRLAMRTIRHRAQRTLNTVTTNVPGPQFPLFCLGRRMTEYRPYVPISHGLRLGTAILSYDGRLFFGVTGDEDSTPDVDVVANGIEAGISELVAASA